MDKEYEMIIELLAEIRDNMNDEDFIDDEGFDRLDCCVGSPLEVLMVIEMKLKRLYIENEILKKK